MLQQLLKSATLFHLLASSCFSADYFVSSAGDDANSGRSSAQAWKTPARVSSQQFQAGDRILFNAGDTFRGTVVLTGEDSGAVGKPVEINTFGVGPNRAQIVAGKETGVHATDVENLIIKNLVIVGDGPTNNSGYGINVENTATNRMLKGLLIDSVEVNGFGKHGILVTGNSYGYEDVTIERCSMLRNRKGGLEVAGKLPWDSKMYAHKNVTVSQCRAFDNPGDSTYTKNHSGSGLVLYQVDGGRIEKSAAWNNGEFCPAEGGGPVGIWTCASRRVVIEYCESFGNQTQGLDGGGFDIDGGSEECVLQYNYSHDNDGPGLMAYTYPYASYQDRSNVVRFNISINDAVESERYGGLYIRADGRKMERLEVYNNTIVTKGRYAAVVNAADVEAILSNNLFVSGSNGMPLRVEGITNEVQVNLRHNLYWRGGGPFLVRWGDRKLNSLKEFQDEAKQEMFQGERLGAFLDPRIEVRSSVLNDPVSNLRVLTHFTPRESSVRISGKALALSTLRPVEDFLGYDLKMGDPVPLGAVRGQ